MVEYLQEIDRLERDVTAHVHAQLGDYSRKHYTVNYEDFTAECVAEFLDELQCAPLTDPNAFKLPEDPLKVLFKLKNIDALPPYEEPDRTNPEAISLLKNVQAQMRRVAPGRLRSERVPAESNHLIPEPAIPADFMLTAQARRHCRFIGKGRYKKDVPTGFKVLQSAHISAGLMHIEDVAEPSLPVDELLKIEWDKNDPQVRACLSDAIKVHKAAPKFDDQHYLDKFTHLPKSEVALPEIQFMVMFPRSRQPGYRSDTHGTALELVNFEDLKTVLPPVEQEQAASSDDLPTQNMRLIDGWQTICSSPPSSPDSPGVSDEDPVDELCLPSTPNTEPPTVEDMLRPKLEIPLFPRSRRRGGRSGVQPKLLAGKTIATFLPSLIPPEAHNKAEEKPSIPDSPVPATSVLGQASTVDAELKPNPDDNLDVELEHICKDVVDPFAPIMEETIDDRSIPLMEVPTLPDPTERKCESTWIPKALKELVAANPTEDARITRPYVKKAPAKQSITLALSWALCEVSEKPPPLIQILDVESPLDSRDSGNHAAMLTRVEELLSKCSVSEAAPPTSTISSALECRRLEALTEQVPLPKDPFKRSTLLPSRLDRQRLKGKRKLGDDRENDLDSEEIGRPQTSQNRQSTPSPKRARTKEGIDEGRIPTFAYEANDGNVLQQHEDHDIQMQDERRPTEVPVHPGANSFQDLGNMMAPLQPGVYEEEDKENWNPSSGFSDGLFGDIPGYAFDGGTMASQEMGYMFDHGIAEDELVYDPQMPLDGPQFEQDAETAFEPLVMDVQHRDNRGQWKGAPPEVPIPALLPSPLSSSGGIRSGVPARLQQHAARSSPTIPRIDPSHAQGLFSHSLGLFEFARLRSVKLPPPTLQDDHDISLEGRQDSAGPEVCPLQNDSPARNTLPPEIIDGNTIPTEEVTTRMAPPNTVHRYLASLDILQKRALVRSLTSSDCFVDLIERTSLGGSHIIIDASTAIMFVPLLTLGAECASWVERVSAQSWKFSLIYLIFEAYPESCAFKSQERRSALNAYTPPILKAIKKFRRDIGLAEAFNTKSTGCRIRFGFADCVAEAARFVRHAGEVAEAADVTGGEIWGDREWLDQEHEDEQDLASVAGMNYFSAALILSQIDLEEFLKMDPRDRLSQFGGFVGADTITSLNNDIAQRYERLSSVGDSDHHLDLLDDDHEDQEQDPMPMYY